MRFTSFACVLTGIMVLVGACSKPGYTSKNLEEISSYFADMPNRDPSSQIGKFRTKLPYYKQFLAENLKADPKDHVTVIFMAHNLVHPSGDQLQQIENSQNAVKWILENTHPTLIGAEGSFSPHLSAQQILADCATLAADLGTICNTSLADFGSAERYISTHPTINAMGIEDKELVEASILMNSVLASLGSDSPSVVGLVTYIEHLRSEMALALTLHRMREEGAHTATIVIGGWHQDDFIRMKNDMSLNVTYYCAIGDPSTTNTSLSDYQKCEQAHPNSL